MNGCGGSLACVARSWAQPLKQPSQVLMYMHIQYTPYTNPLKYPYVTLYKRLKYPYVTLYNPLKYTCIYIYICIFIYILREREGERGFRVQGVMWFSELRRFADLGFESLGFRGEDKRPLRILPIPKDFCPPPFPQDVQILRILVSQI